MRKRTTSIHAAILGGTGYGGGELLRLLTQHPQASVVSVTSTSQVGRGIAEVHPHLRGFYELPMTEAVDFERLLQCRAIRGVLRDCRMVTAARQRTRCFAKLSTAGRRLARR